MGLLDDLAGAVLGGGHGASNDQTTALVQGVIEALGGSQSGSQTGVDDLMRRFQQGGAGDILASWLGTGANQSIGGDALSQVLKGSSLEQAAQRAGLGGATGSAILAQLLPMLIDKLSPNGQVPPPSQLRDLSNQIASGDSPFARPGRIS